MFDPIPTVVTIVAAVVLANLYGLYLWYRIRNLVFKTADEMEKFVGEHVGVIYTRYLYYSIAVGRCNIVPKMVMQGNPELSPIIKAVKATVEFDRIRELASWIRELPVNLIVLY